MAIGISLNTFTIAMTSILNELPLSHFVRDTNRSTIVNQRAVVISTAIHAWKTRLMLKLENSAPVVIVLASATMTHVVIEPQIKKSAMHLVSIDELPQFEELVNHKDVHCLDACENNIYTATKLFKYIAMPKAIDGEGITIVRTADISNFIGTALSFKSVVNDMCDVLLDESRTNQFNIDIGVLSFYKQLRKGEQ